MAGNDGKYDIALDPLWNGESEHESEQFGKEEIAFYQCDHLGTPQELTDHEGKVAWSAQYKAWGQAKEAISDAAFRAGLRNPIRFQGQYLDDETGLHYNRHRYYDPSSGHFVSRDPIGLAGGVNGRAYAPNPVQWVDPLGLKPNQCTQQKSGRFSSADAAAKAALLRYNGKSIRDSREYGGLIYKTPNGRYDFTKASKGDMDGVNPWEFGEGRIPKCAQEGGYWHTHGSYSDRNGIPTTKDKDAFNSDNFSQQDRDVANMMGQGKTEYKGYVGTPSGAFKGYNGKTGKTYAL
jgi:RHS repeat-associated protein